MYCWCQSAHERPKFGRLASTASHNLLEVKEEGRGRAMADGFDGFGDDVDDDFGDDFGATSTPPSLWPTPSLHERWWMEGGLIHPSLHAPANAHLLCMPTFMHVCMHCIQYGDVCVLFSCSMPHTYQHQCLSYHGLYARWSAYGDAAATITCMHGYSSMCDGSCNPPLHPRLLTLSHMRRPCTAAWPEPCCSGFDDDFAGALPVEEV